MKTKDIAKQYGIDQVKFEGYLRKVGAGKDGLMAYTLDENISGHVEGFKAFLAEEQAKADAAAKAKADEERRKQEAADAKQRALASMLISSGFSFDGYKIVKYSGYISGDDCVTMPRDDFWGSNKVSDNLCGALVKIRRQAIKELKEAAYDLGCNAVVGVDFDYLTMDPQHAAALNVTQTVYEPYVICVTANGNAVVIEKE